MRIYLIRHGETTGDVEDRYGGDYDDDLTQKGRTQAKKLAQKLRNKKIEVVFSSPLKRTQQTAMILSENLGIKVRILKEIKERNHYGILTGMVKSEARKKYPKLAEDLKDYKKTIEGAESYKDFLKRINQAFKIIYASKYKTVAIVTHGGPFRAVFRELLGEGKIGISDCSYAVLEYENKKLSLLESDGIVSK